MILEPREGGPAPGVEELREQIAARLDRAPRFRRRLSPTPLGIANPVWIDDEAFDIAKHVRAVPIAGAVDRERLGEIVADLMSERLDRSRPLWALDVVEHAGGRLDCAHLADTPLHGRRSHRRQARLGAALGRGAAGPGA